MNIVQNIWGKFHRITEMVLDVLESGTDYITFQERLREELNELGCQISREVLEGADGYLRAHREQRAGWEIERRNEPKNILTPFGQITYKRTYYRHKETGTYAHLVDRLAGHGPHARVDATLKADVVDLATELSYRKSGQEVERQARGVILSGTAVMQAIRVFDLKRDSPLPPLKKRRCAVLFVEADEDHVASQRGGVHLPRLVYVHEGKERVGKERYRLKRPHYLAGIYADTEDLWYEVLAYLDRNYDLEHVERIFLGGDGDGWIKKGLQILPKSVFVLDLFHLDKYLVAALGRNTEAHRAVWAALRAGDWPAVRALLKEAEVGATTPGQKKAIRECRQYIRRNWDGILAYRLYPEANLGVSAEGHVSHILSARLSSRPSAWSRTGADQMARLRALKANGVNLRERYLAQCRCQLSSLRVDRTSLVREREKLRRVVGEVLDNLPVLRGPVTQLRRVLKGISRDLSLI